MSGTEFRENQPRSTVFLKESGFILGGVWLCEYGIFRIFERSTICLRNRIIWFKIPVGMTFAKVLAVVIEDPLGLIVMKDMTAKSGLEMATVASGLAV